MNKADEFLTNFPSIKDSPDFWRQYFKFTKNIGKSDIQKLVAIIPEVVAKIENDAANHELYRHLHQACEIDIKFGKSLYEEIIQSSNERLLSLVNSIISGVSKNDFNWAKEKVLVLIEDSNKLKLKQAITSMAFFRFHKKKSTDFIETIDKKFMEITKTEDSVEILASVIFACRNQRENLPNADQNILALLHKESPKIKIELLNVLNFSSNIETEVEFYKKVLGSLVSLDLKFELAYNSLAFKLKEHVDNHFLIVKDFLNSWISHSKENARNIKLLKPIIDEIYNCKPASFQKILTEWLNDDTSNFHIAVFALVQEMNYQNITSLQLDSNLIQSFEFEDIEYVTRKIIGYVLPHEISANLLYSILEKRYDDEKVVLFIGNIFIDYLIFNYYSTIDYLNERKKDTKGHLKKVITRIIEDGKKYYSAYKELEVLKEFEPSESRLNYMHKIQNKKFNKSYEQNNENRNSFLNMLTTLHFRAGKTAFGKFDNNYSNPMQPQLISHSAEIPRGEYIDPTGQAQLRLECQNFIRRK